MYTLGIDIGSTTSKCVILKDGAEIAASSLIVGGIGTGGTQDALDEVFRAAALRPEDIACTAATGYGRNLYSEADFQMSELSCHAAGAHLVFPDARTVIDIGGQDVKIISLDAAGRMKNFVMNDKCAAGTGRFLDVMANILRVETSELGAYALRAEKPAQISSTCTVFAESEVISQLANGVALPDLIAGICDSVASRVASLAKRLGVVPELVMSGGVSKNAGVLAALEKRLEMPVFRSENSQLFGALGAAIYAYNKSGQ